jgi:hypothetical protein
LKGASSFIHWKVRVTLILMENWLWYFSNTIMTPPTNPKELTIHEKKEMKSIRIILDVVKDHYIPHLSENTSGNYMFIDMKNIFQRSNANTKMVLRENIRDTKMTRLDKI